MKKITHIQAQSIIDIACSDWAEKLYQKWGRDIVFKNNINITDSDYVKMREACTPEQHKLFDEIFGKDYTFKKGDYFTVVKGCFGYNGKEGKTYKVTKVVEEKLYYETSISINTIRVKVRKATPEEIKNVKRPLFSAKKGDWVVIVEGVSGSNCFHNNGIYQLEADFVQGDTVFSVLADDENDRNALFSHYLDDYIFRFATPEEIEKVQYLPEGTPCFVRAYKGMSWRLAYANGNGKFYHSGKKSGDLMNWECVHECAKGFPEE